MASDSNRSIRYLETEDYMKVCNKCMHLKSIPTIQCKHRECSHFLEDLCPPCYVVTHQRKHHHGCPSFIRRFHPQMRQCKLPILVQFTPDYDQHRLCYACDLPPQVYCFTCEYYLCCDHHTADESHKEALIVFDPDRILFHIGEFPRIRDLSRRTDITQESMASQVYGYYDDDPYEFENVESQQPTTGIQLTNQLSLCPEILVSTLPSS
jgi:hypothetical protein